MVWRNELKELLGDDSVILSSSQSNPGYNANDTTFALSSCEPEAAADASVPGSGEPSRRHGGVTQSRLANRPVAAGVQLLHPTKTLRHDHEENARR